LALFLPWQLQLGDGRLGEVLIVTLTGTPTPQRIFDNFREWQFAWRYVPDWLIVLGSAGLAWAFVRRRREVLALGVWVALLALLVLGRLVKFPTSAFFDNLSLIIGLYMPVAWCVGWLAQESAQAAGRRAPRVVPPLAAGIVTVLALWGAARAEGPDLSTFMMVTPPDQQALAWVREHVPEDALFAVNGFTISNQTLIVGSDAGWWLPLLGGRDNLMPPQYALTSEAESVPGYRRTIVELVKELAASPLPQADGVASLCRAGVTHVYAGQRGGLIGRPSAGEVGVQFDPQAIASSPAFKTVYHQDLVWVFELDQAACER
jgi:hypothetical protein